LKILRSDYDYEKLDDATKLSYILAERSLNEKIAGYEWRHHNYPANQMFGWQSAAPSFLINFHRVTSVDDAEAYISRLEAFKASADQHMARMKRNQAMGVLPPKFVFTYVIDDARNVMQGAPFTDGDDSALLADFKKKVAALTIEDENISSDLINRAKNALMTSVKPAYEELISLAEAQAAVPDADEIMVMGGAEIYTLLLAQADRLYITKIDAVFEGDAWFPEFDCAAWQELSHQQGIVDEKNHYPHAFVIMERKT